MEEKEYTIEDIINEASSLKNMHTYCKGNIYLSGNQINLLEQCHINYKEYNDVKQLMYEIEENLEQSDELEQLLIDISEFNYYHNTHQ